MNKLSANIAENIVREKLKVSSMYEPTKAQREALKEKYPFISYSDVYFTMSPAGDLRAGGKCQMKLDRCEGWPATALHVKHYGSDIYPSCHSCWSKLGSS